jgi:hypothetical protein
MNLLHLDLPITARMERGTPGPSASAGEAGHDLRHLTASDRGAISERMQELDDEHPIENILETSAAGVCVAALALGLAIDDRWFVLPVIVSALLLQQVLQGWCPALPVLRGLGFRTAREIHLERHALEQIEQAHAEAQCRCPFQVREDAAPQPEESPAPAADSGSADTFSLRQFLLTGAQ